MDVDNLLSFLRPSPEQTINERYSKLMSLKVVFYDQSNLDTDGSMNNFCLNEKQLKELSRDPLVKVVKSLMSKFDSHNFCYMVDEEPCYFCGGGVEKIIGRVPYQEKNSFYQPIKDLVDYFKIPILDKNDEEYKNKINIGFSGYIHFLYLEMKKIEGLDEKTRFLIFALPSRSYVQQEYVRNLMSE